MSTVSAWIAQPLAGASAPVHEPAVPAVGAFGFPASPPPPTCARLVSVPAALAATATGKLNALLPETAITVELVQVTVCPDAAQLQFAPLAPPGVKGEAPVYVNPAGSTSTMVMVPDDAMLPVLVTVSVYVVVPPAGSTLLLLALVRPRLTTLGALTVSVSTTQPLVGASTPVQAPAVDGVGVGSSGSPPPPTCALLVTLLPATRPTPTLTVKLNALLPAAAITVELVQVIACPDALQLQFAPCAPPGVNGEAPA